MTRLLTHIVDAVRMLLTQFRGRPRIEAVAETVGERAQGVEDVLWQVLTLRSLESAIGAQLDGIGAVIGEARQGRTDDVYRLYLRARIRLNISSGTGEDLLAILGLVLAGANRVRLVKTPPASLFVELTGALVDPASDVASIVGAAISAGVRVQLIYSLSDDDATFAFARGDTPEILPGVPLVDGDMEASGTSAWTPLLGTIPSKTPGAPGGVGVQVLHLESTLSWAAVRQEAGLVSGNKYLVTGWARGSGYTAPVVRSRGSPIPMWLGGVSAAWQRVYAVHTVSVLGSSDLELAADRSSPGDAVEFDDIRVFDVTGMADDEIALIDNGLADDAMTAGGQLADVEDCNG